LQDDALTAAALELAIRQEELAREADRLAKAEPTPDAALETAAEALRDAARALSELNPAAAVEAQEEGLAALRRSMNSEGEPSIAVENARKAERLDALDADLAALQEKIGSASGRQELRDLIPEANAANRKLKELTETSAPATGDASAAKGNADSSRNPDHPTGRSGEEDREETTTTDTPRDGQDRAATPHGEGDRPDDGRPRQVGADGSILSQEPADLPNSAQEHLRETIRHLAAGRGELALAELAAARKQSRAMAEQARQQAQQGNRKDNGQQAPPGDAQDKPQRSSVAGSGNPNDASTEGGGATTDSAGVPSSEPVDVARAVEAGTASWLNQLPENSRQAVLAAQHAGYDPAWEEEVKRYYLELAR
jgi:hypothetical protein